MNFYDVCLLPYTNVVRCSTTPYDKRALKGFIMFYGKSDNRIKLISCKPSKIVNLYIPFLIVERKSVLEIL